MSEVGGHPLDRIVVVRIENDDMEAYISFVHSFEGDIPKGVIYDIISSYDIKYGLNPSLVEDAINKYKENPKENVKKNYLVAKGLPMKPGQNGRVDFFIEEAAPVAIDETGKADFRNIEKFRTVERGTVLAKYYPAVKGTPGYNVYGDKLTPPDVTEVRVSAGENVTMNESTGELIANVTGIYTKVKNVLSVNQILTIDNNVGLETGNIHYEGVIKVQGNVEQGAEVTSDSDLYVDGLIESGKVRVGGSLNVVGGLKTRNSGLIFVKNDVNASFIENSNIYADGSITVVSSIIGSNVTCCGDIILLKDGNKIVGGEVMALTNIVTDSLGNMNETQTTITIGIHAKYRKIYEKTLAEFTGIEGRLKEYIEKVREMKDYIQRMQRNLTTQKKLEFKKLFDDYKACESEFKEKQQKLELVKKKRYYDGDVFIHVKDTLYRGVTIHYFNLTEKITQEYKHCTLRFRRGETGFSLEPYSPATDLFPT